MQIPILIEPVEGGRYHARAGDPFATSAEGATAKEAMRQLESLLQGRLSAGAHLSTITLGNGSPCSVQAPLRLEPLPDDDWFFQTMQVVFTENRRREDEVAG